MGKSRSLTTTHTVDEKTGMLNPSGNFPQTFDADRKSQFLTVYKNENIGIRKACRKMGMSVSTINHHLKIDPVFKDAFDECEREYLENLECVSRENALNPKSVIERIFQLKCLHPTKYGQENNSKSTEIVVNIDMGKIAKARQLEAAIDAKIVSNNDQKQA
jgi:hypothetical protein